MPKLEQYDILVLGSGEAGKYLAWTMAKAGHQTAMVGRMPFTMLRDAIFTHPTISEGLVFLLGQVKISSSADGMSTRQSS